MKLIYWIATQDDAAPCDDIVARTRRECLALCRPGYSKPEKVVVYFQDAFELMDWFRVRGDGCIPYAGGSDETI